jgi:hypothetical protein
MSVTLKFVGEAVEVLQGASSLPEGEGREDVLFSASVLNYLDRGRRDEVDADAFLPCGDEEDEDAEELFHQ